MASTSSPLLLVFSPPLSPSVSSNSLSSPNLGTAFFPHRLGSFSTRTRIKSSRLSSVINLRNHLRKEEIVIVGSGIAGLTTSLALHRLGLRSLVLEQAESLPTGGTSLTLFKNGWRVLDSIGVGDDLRNQFLELKGMVVNSQDGRKLRSFKFKDADEGQEVRAVERRVLLETLASQLPPKAIHFSSKLMKIHRSNEGELMLELVDGTRLATKILIGCDGVRSSVAKWMGFSEPKFVGHCAFRGLGFYPNGQKALNPNVNYVFGRGIRAGYVPLSPSKIYWFICFNSSSPPGAKMPPRELKKQAIKLVKEWPAELLKIIENTEDDVVILTPLVDQWLWPGVSRGASNGSVVLAGDAWHPMTPNLGQGACCAMEDAVVLARKVASTSSGSYSCIEDSFRAYENERWARMFALTVRANLIGSVLQWDNPLVCSVRDRFVIPWLLQIRPLLEHTQFDCGPLL